MSHQERVLPACDGDLYLAYLLCGENLAATARHFGADESSVRRRIHRFLPSAPKTS